MCPSSSESFSSFLICEIDFDPSVSFLDFRVRHSDILCPDFLQNRQRFFSSSSCFSAGVISESFLNFGLYSFLSLEGLYSFFRESVVFFFEEVSSFFGESFSSFLVYFSLY